MRKELHNTPNYLVDTEGEIYNAKTGKRKSQFVNKDGYKTVDIYVNNKCTKYAVHRFVAIAFIPNPENKPCVNHIDGNKTNNRVSNLEWVTYSENNFHAFSAGLSTPRLGVDNNMASISEDTARTICKMIEDGYRNKEIYSLLQISPHIVKQIRAGRTWTHISKDYKLNSKAHTVSDSTVHWICMMIQDGYKNTDIVSMATSARVNKSLVTRIRCKRSFTEISSKYKI